MAVRMRQERMTSNTNGDAMKKTLIPVAALSLVPNVAFAEANQSERGPSASRGVVRSRVARRGAEKGVGASKYRCDDIDMRSHWVQPSGSNTEREGTPSRCGQWITSGTSTVAGAL